MSMRNFDSPYSLSEFPHHRDSALPHSWWGTAAVQFVVGLTTVVDSTEEEKCIKFFSMNITINLLFWRINWLGKFEVGVNWEIPVTPWLFQATGTLMLVLLLGNEILGWLLALIRLFCIGLNPLAWWILVWQVLLSAPITQQTENCTVLLILWVVRLRE